MIDANVSVDVRHAAPLSFIKICLFFYRPVPARNKCISAIHCVRERTISIRPRHSPSLTTMPCAHYGHILFLSCCYSLYELALIWTYGAHYADTRGLCPYTVRINPLALSPSKGVCSTGLRQAQPERTFALDGFNRTVLGLYLEVLKLLRNKPL